MSYCKFAPGNPIHEYYHAKEYGFPVADDNVLLERLALEINQAGLSWDLMLKKRAGFNQAFKNFEVEKVARFGARDVTRLLKDAGIIRNRLKIEAVIHNAKVVRELQKAHGSFAAWIAAEAAEMNTEKDWVHPAPNFIADEIRCWVKLFKRQGFKFVGGEVLKEFLQSIGQLPSPHDKMCPVNKDIFKTKVLAIVKAIPKGETMTYGEVAKRAGNPRAARAVGALMSRNQDKNIPCHRVVGTDGKLKGYNGLRGPSKAAILRKEGVVL